MTRRLTLFLTLASCLVATTAHAQFNRADPATGETYKVEVAYGWWRPEPTISVSSESLGIPGTLIDFETDLGILKERIREIRVVLRPAKKHKFRIDYLPIGYEVEDHVLSREIVFNGQSFVVGLPINVDAESIVADVTGEIGGVRMLRHACDEIRCGAHISRKRSGVAIGNSARKLDRGIRSDRGTKRRCQLIKMLMREENTDIEFSGLGEKRLQILVKILGRFIYDEERGVSLRRRNRDTFEGGGDDPSNHGATEERRRIALEERLAGANQDYSSVLQSLEHVEAVVRRREHAVEGRDLKHAIKTAGNLLLGGGIGLCVKNWLRKKPCDV